MHTQPIKTSGCDPFDVTVIIPTTLRPSLLGAVRSIFEQDFAGRIQIMIGIDTPKGDPSILDTLMQECPPTMMISIINPGYSTAARNGGLHECFGGGAIRPIMCFAAHSRYLAFLDDDNWFEPNHIISLMNAISGHDYAYSRRFVVDPHLGQIIDLDLGVSLGIHIWLIKEKAGSFFTDTNTLLIDKVRCQQGIARWIKTCFDGGKGEDRSIGLWLFENRSGAATGIFSCYYNASNGYAEALRLKMRNEGNPWIWDKPLASNSDRHQHFIETIATQPPILHLDPIAEANSPISTTATKTIMAITGAISTLVLRDRNAHFSRALAQATDRPAAFIGVDSGCGDLTDLQQADLSLAGPRLATKTIRAEQIDDRTSSPSLFFLRQTPRTAMSYFAHHQLPFDLIMLAPTPNNQNYTTKLLHQAWRLIPAGGSLAAVDAIAINALKLFARGVAGQLIGDHNQPHWIILRK